LRLAPPADIYAIITPRLRHTPMTLIIAAVAAIADAMPR
jgi:hypothetical protein